MNTWNLSPANKKTDFGIYKGWHAVKPTNQPIVVQTFGSINSTEDYCFIRKPDVVLINIKPHYWIPLQSEVV